MCQRGYADKESGKLTIPPEDLEKYKKILSATNWQMPVTVQLQAFTLLRNNKILKPLISK